MSVQRLFVACLFLIFLLPVLVGRSQENHHGNDMRQKLEHSQQILDGLVNEDFAKIRAAANALNDLGKRKWTENESAAYRTQNQVFWFTTGTLLTAAEDKNIDAATLSYTQMTHSCVNCHKLLRTQ